MENLKNKTAVITGGNSGIGYAAAKQLKEQGVNVIITGRRKEAIEKAALDLGVTGITADQSNISDIEKLAEQVKADFGSVDILFINAGIAGLGTIEQTTEELYDNIMNVNLKGAFFTLSKFIPILKDGASVVFLSSNTASMPGPGSSVYSASKTALNSVMKSAAVELAPRKIRVNSVSPGPTQTEVMKKVGLDESTVKSIMDVVVEKVPLKQMGKAEDVAKMVSHLSSDAAVFITGADFIMDGGMILV
ncbi:NAD(P)-dependent dehydrogenase (short-subunit alcohol dehydrogenase family) [Flavobacterium nitrogenifigens]|uniref:NAD(P)-dependent dehydrogenase (Short-subunit alcohol dehydrogenase family) n=2 Tax=Flavobacterium TaxID=237 RepID=A0A7W7IYY7_9FLAO|nr:MULTISPECIES: SDR family oxidoreductase [Flavobacterium]MBB4802707.1 NAD(P)-dependent dehydrogenase (short-subunit alcohol dehydrogenase family) [Flavobacterium nitrogenifigens]MBB6387665.1 NAD(P)-dependent dehydrogenase (short-subunit alcohol dehydrogenase family) [Flavobacterium notoginsengisoli]